MLKILNAKLQKMSDKKLMLTATAITFLSDLVLVYYVHTVLMRRFLTDQVVAVLLSKQGLSFGQVEMDSFRELILSTLGTICFFVLLYNLFFYIMSLKGKRWARRYLSFYTLSAVTLSIFEIILSLFKPEIPFSTITLGTALSYGLVYYGLKVRTAEQ